MCVGQARWTNVLGASVRHSTRLQGRELYWRFRGVRRSLRLHQCSHSVQDIGYGWCILTHRDDGNCNERFTILLCDQRLNKHKSPGEKARQCIPNSKLLSKRFWFNSSTFGLVPFLRSQHLRRISMYAILGSDITPTTGE